MGWGVLVVGENLERTRGPRMTRTNNLTNPAPTAGFEARVWFVIFVQLFGPVLVFYYYFRRFHTESLLHYNSS